MSSVFDVTFFWQAFVALRPSGVGLSTRIAGLLLSAIAVQLIVEAIKTFATNG
jgi:small neutral amino acid transporter SnatA (MarC family)